MAGIRFMMGIALAGVLPLLLGGCETASHSNARGGLSDEQLRYGHESNRAIFARSQSDEVAAGEIFATAMDSDLDGEKAEIYRAQLCLLFEHLGEKRFFERLALEDKLIQQAVRERLLLVGMRRANLQP